MIQRNNVTQAFAFTSVQCIRIQSRISISTLAMIIQLESCCLTWCLQRVMSDWCRIDSRLSLSGIRPHVMVISCHCICNHWDQCEDRWKTLKRSSENRISYHTPNLTTSMNSHSKINVNNLIIIKLKDRYGQYQFCGSSLSCWWFQHTFTYIQFVSTSHVFRTTLHQTVHSVLPVTLQHYR